MNANILLFDLAGRGSVVLGGKDRASFLQGLVTNDVKKLTSGQGCAAAFLTPKGKLLAECVVLCEEDRLVLDTPPDLAATVEQLLRKYLVFNDVTISNETGDTRVFHLAGEATGEEREEDKEGNFLRRVIGRGADGALPVEPHSSRAAQFASSENLPPPGGAAGAAPPRAAGGGAIRIVRENRTGIPGFDIRCPSFLSQEIPAALVAAGARLETPERLEALRIAAGIPRWGAELTESVLPDEAGLRERGFISETKGCYVGQEIVARIKTYGHVNRKLVLLSVSGGIPKTGEKIFFEGEECGTVTSATSGDAPGGGVALAYVRRERANVGTALTISSFAGTLSSAVVPSPVPLA